MQIANGEDNDRTMTRMTCRKLMMRKASEKTKKRMKSHSSKQAKHKNVYDDVVVE